MRQRDKTHNATSTRFNSGRIAVVAGVALLVLLVIAPGATAFETRTPLGSFGVDGTDSTTFVAPGNLAFDQASDRLYVVEEQGTTIHAFDAPAHAPAAGLFPLTAGGPRPAATPPHAIAVDQTLGGSAGNIYLAHANGRDVFGFDSAATALGGNWPLLFKAPASICGTAVGSSGAVWIADGRKFSSIHRYDSAGNKQGEVQIGGSAGPGSACSLAVDSSDNLYAVVQRGFLGEVWNLTAATGYDPGTAVRIGTDAAKEAQIAIDITTDRLYVANPAGATGSGVSGVSVYDSAGNPLYEFGIPGRRVVGVAVDESTDRVYVSSAGSGVNNPGTQKVHVFGALAEYPDASATPQPATAITGTEAELHATIDDESELGTVWRFQVSKDGGATWSGAGGSCFQVGVTPGGESDFPVSCTAGNLQSNTDYRFRAVTNKGPGSEDVFSTDLGFKTDEIPPASATLDPASSVTAESAHLSGTLDDNGTFPTTWRFELSSDGGATWTTAQNGGAPISGVTAGNQSGAPVAGTATGLDPNTQYSFRLVTRKDPSSPDVPFEGPAPFTTLAVPPVLSAVGAARITDTSMYLVGEVNPRNQATEYSFEYGPTPALGSATPLTALPAGLENVVVLSQLTGLSPGATVHFKLVAENNAGTAESALHSATTRSEPLPPSSPPGCPNQALREEQESTYLPDCRAYEQVSPADKNFGDIRSPGGQMPSLARDGQAASFCTLASFADPPAQSVGTCTTYRSGRTVTGWRTASATPPYCAYDVTSTDPFPVGQAGIVFDSNLDHGALALPEANGCEIPPLDPAATVPARNIYRADYATVPPSHQLMAPEPCSGCTSFKDAAASFAAGSADFSHVVYSSTGQQTAEALGGGFAQLFEWHEGALRLVSKDTANQPFTSATSIASSQALAYPVSADGNRIFFTHSGSGGAIFMRQLGTATHQISQSECTSSCGSPATPNFAAAIPSGAKALFTSAAKLTNSDTSATGADLYLYTHSANPAANQNLTLISADGEPGDGTEAGVAGVLGMSDDGETVFFVANGQLVAGASTDPGPKLYRWQRNGGSPTLEYLGTGPGEPEQWTSQARRKVTPDGAHLLFRTDAPLDVAADHDADADVYRWEEQGGWACASCQLPGGPSAGDATGRIAIGEDGERVFFVSPDALLSADVNGEEDCPIESGTVYVCQDLYEWHEGTLSLLSSGEGARGVRFWGASDSGDDVLFSTRERLVGWDVDDNEDLYDARVEGGFAEPAATPPPCELNSGGCEGPATAAPPTSGAGSAAFQGPGNSRSAGPSGKRCPKGKRRVRAKGKPRCVKRGKSKRDRRRAANRKGRTAR